MRVKSFFLVLVLFILLQGCSKPDYEGDGDIVHFSSNHAHRWKIILGEIKSGENIFTWLNYGNDLYYLYLDYEYPVEQVWSTEAKSNFKAMLKEADVQITIKGNINEKGNIYHQGSLWSDEFKEGEFVGGRFNFKWKGAENKVMQILWAPEFPGRFNEVNKLKLNNTVSVEFNDEFMGELSSKGIIPKLSLRAIGDY